MIDTVKGIEYVVFDFIFNCCMFQIYQPIYVVTSAVATDCCIVSTERGHQSICILLCDKRYLKVDS